MYRIAKYNAQVDNNIVVYIIKEHLCSNYVESLDVYDELTDQIILTRQDYPPKRIGLYELHSIPQADFVGCYDLDNNTRKSASYMYYKSPNQEIGILSITAYI